ncbi:MAG: phytanoyl-CoA dioxygenase family protein [Abitibacteriaceae bacterium]|nr:phytanoyl-CoA dioxygenase family protein [Abditibacteriaceae bacterium]
MAPLNLQAYHENGYLIVRDLLHPDELTALCDATDYAVAQKIEPILFEQETPEACAAVPQLYKDERGRVFRRLNRVIDRGGAFSQIVSGPLAQATTQLLPSPFGVCLNRHNMVMLKAPFNPAPVLWHQDAAVWDEGTFAHLSTIVALDDFLPENGCLEVVPGSHHAGPVGLGWEENTERIAQTCRRDIEQHAVKVDLKAGDAVFFHGLLLHGSAGNNSTHTRRSLTVAFFPGDLRTVSTRTGAGAPETLMLS